MSVKFSYVNFHDKKYIHFDGLVAKLREMIENSGGDPEKTKIDLEKLVDWLEEADYPEPIYLSNP